MAGGEEFAGELRKRLLASVWLGKNTGRKIRTRRTHHGASREQRGIRGGVRLVGGGDGLLQRFGDGT